MIKTNLATVEDWGMTNDLVFRSAEDALRWAYGMEASDPYPKVNLSGRERPEEDLLNRTDKQAQATLIIRGCKEKLSSFQCAVLDAKYTIPNEPARKRFYHMSIALTKSIANRQREVKDLEKADRVFQTKMHNTDQPLPPNELKQYKRICKELRFTKNRLKDLQKEADRLARNPVEIPEQPLRTITKQNAIDEIARDECWISPLDIRLLADWAGFHLKMEMKEVARQFNISERHLYRKKRDINARMNSYLDQIMYLVEPDLQVSELVTGGI